MDEAPRYNPLRPRAFQYRLSSLFLATGILCALLTAANRLAVAYRVTVDTVFLYFVVGFIVWSFLGSLLGLAWAFHRTGSLRKSLGCVVWPGLTVGIVAAFVLTTKLPIQFLWYVIGALCIFVIAYAVYSARDAFSTDELRRWRFSILTMSILALASGCGLVWVIFGDIPALRPTRTFFVALDEPIDVPAGTPVYKLNIVIGYVKGLDRSPSGVGQIMQIEIFDDIVTLYRHEECLISLDRERLPQRIELTRMGTSVGLEVLRDQDVIRGHIR